MKPDEIKELEQFKNSLMKYDRIILYGAGIWGDLLLKRIYEWKMYKKVTFAITGEPNEKEHLGIDVISVDSLKKCKDNYIVIISVGKALNKELCDYLDSNNISSYIALNDSLRRALKEELTVCSQERLKPDAINRLEEFKDTLMKYDKIVLYGAGIWGELLLQRIYEWKLFKKVIFAVTNTSRQKEHMGIDVVSIDSLKACKDNYIIIVSVGQALKGELCDYLNLQNIEPYIALDVELQSALRVNTIFNKEISLENRGSKKQAVENNPKKNNTVVSSNDSNFFMGVEQKYLIHLLEKSMGIAQLDAIELYFIEVKVKRDFSFGAWPTRLHCCVRTVCGQHSGWGEMCLPLYANSSMETVISNTINSFAPWKGVSLEKAQFLVKALREKTPDRILEALDMSLVDLEARIKGMSGLEFLQIDNDYAVPALSCVLKKDIGEAVQAAKKMATTHLKIKLFGDNIHDYKLISAVREVIPSDCYLVGDVNMGYLPGKETQPFNMDIVKALSNLQEAGLSACEDPGNLSWEDLEKLQNHFPNMPIIPDELMRPAYKVIKTVKPVAKHIYNLHPNCMGSFTETVELAQKLKAAGSNVMIGDASLIGPACVAWQQVACGVEAAWCEAIEKPAESTAFTDCIVCSPMEVLADGRRRIAKKALGFGLQVDVEKLAGNCIRVVNVL